MQRDFSFVRGALAAVIVSTLVAVGVPASPVSANPVVIDANFAEVVFDYSDHTNITPPSPDCLLSDTSAYCVGKESGDIVRFNDVLTVGGQRVDAVVTTVDTTAAVRRYEVSSSSSWENNPDWFWTRLSVSSSGDASTFNLTFYLGGTYTGPGTGTPVTLRNVAFTAIEIDNNQFVRFGEVQGYTLSAPTELTYDPVTGTFQSSGNSGNADSPEFRVVVTYSALNTLTFAFGRATVNDENNFALAGENLGFGGATVIERGPVFAETPEPVVEGTPVPEIGFVTTPPTDLTDWTTAPTCSVFSPSDTSFNSPLSGALAPGAYVTHCSGGSSEVFEPTEYVDGTLVVIGSTPSPSPDPSPVVPKYTG